MGTSSCRVRCRPEYLFEGRYKWLTPGSTEGEAFHSHLREQVAGLKEQRFRANKGDVLIWHADLAHGGAPIKDRSRTRLSLVAHYCPMGTYPMYREYTGSGQTVSVGPGAHYCCSKKSYWRSG